jgi:methionyl-tRNA formyltransferase
MINDITVLVDNDSWILPYAEKLVNELLVLNKNVTLAREHKNVSIGNVCFFLGCTKIANTELLSKNKYNLVVHESALPEGKGFAPVTWQILEGKNTIPVCLIEAVNDVDSGDIWLEDQIILDGTELADEWREKQGNISIKLVIEFVQKFETLSSRKQSGSSSIYKRRTPADSELCPEKSLTELMPLLRVVDNKHYPAFFYANGQKYKIIIEKEK